MLIEFEMSTNEITNLQGQFFGDNILLLEARSLESVLSHRNSYAA